MFLLSEESLYIYANSQVDSAALANLFNINVHIYTYSVQSWDAYGQRLPNRWTTTSPDPLLSSFNPIIPGEVGDIVLYNENTTQTLFILNKYFIFLSLQHLDLFVEPANIYWLIGAKEI